MHSSSGRRRFGATANRQVDHRYWIDKKLATEVANFSKWRLAASIRRAEVRKRSPYIIISCSKGRARI
jgi:hypothetical protein